MLMCKTTTGHKMLAKKNPNIAGFYCHSKSISFYLKSFYLPVVHCYYIFFYVESMNIFCVLFSFMFTCPCFYFCLYANCYMPMYVNFKNLE